MAQKMPLFVNMRGIGARFVYILKSDNDPSRHYVGRTANVDERLDWHNASPYGSTSTLVDRRLVGVSG
jgi:predicted GIY-YIG superfamily endonuclease